MKQLFLNRLIFGCIFLSSQFVFSQNLPKEYYFSADGRMLYQGGKPQAGFYNENVIQQIRITLPQANYKALLTQNYAAKKDIGGTMWINGVKFDSVGVRYKGQTSYQRVTNDKKSFNISLDYKYPDANIEGYQSFNFNNGFEDPSFMREVLYYGTIRRHSMAAKANFIHIWVNNQDYGTYLSVQQQNKDFLSDWFLSNDGPNWRAEGPSGATGMPSMGGGGGGFGAGTSSMNYIDDDTTTYKKHYTLKSSDLAYPWKDFPKTTKILNKNPLNTLEEDLKDVMDVDRTLWHLATEILFSDDDSYVNKGGMDYYVCQEATTGRFQSYDYDGNTVMAANAATWSPFNGETKTTHPLLNRLLAVPTIRQRYLAHMRTLVNENFDEKLMHSKIDKYAALIDSVVNKDPIKPTTYAQFQSGVTALKTFVTARRNALLNNIEMKEVAPTITETGYYTNNVAWQIPTAEQAVTIRTKVASTAGVSKVTLYYGTGVYGKFSKVEMLDDGKNNDGAANDGVYGGTIPKQAASTYMRYYVEAAANNTAKSVSYAPVGAEHDVFIYQVKSELAGPVPTKEVVINEVMASNTKTAKDEAGQYDDWIELYNNTDKDVNLSGYYLTDDWAKPKKWPLPNVNIGAKGYLILWADEDEKQSNLHTSFKLSANGEFLMLINKGLQIADSLTFGIQKADIGWARTPNGTGAFKAKTPTFKANNDDGTTTPTNPTNPTSPTGTVTGISPLLVEKLVVFPNPTQGRLQVSYASSDYVELNVTDITGRNILKRYFQTTTTLNTQNWPSGTYVLNVAGVTKKVVKE